MPRQDVPYGGAICRLKERIAEIFDKLGEKLHTINGVPGDGDGNVKIVSGSSAVVITNDPTQNEISVALDNSQLPAAAVSSVNGQTGAVVLTADEIGSDGNSDVQTDIDVNKAAISACSSAITSEQLARQNADNTLQTNINTLSASLPAAAAAAVATDPTVAQLVTGMAGKVDLTDVSTVETPDTIAKRNGSGRLVAADPASGATDKTLTTANWISQTGDTAPNNLVHRSGNEKITGIKEHTNNVYNSKVIPTGSAGWRCVAMMPPSTAGTSIVFNVSSHGAADCALLHYQCRNHNPKLLRLNALTYLNGKIAVVSDSTTEYLYINNASNQELYPMGGNRTVPMTYDNLPTDIYSTDQELINAYNVVTII